MARLIFFIGHAGCGKTTLSKIIAKEMKAVYLDRDTIGTPFVNKMLSMKDLSPDDRDSYAYHQEFRNIEYNALLSIAAENLQLDLGTIVVSPFSKEVSNTKWISEFLEVNQLNNVEVKVVSVYLSNTDIQRERILARNTSRDQWKLNNWNVYKEKLKPVQVSWDSVDVLYYDNSLDLSPFPIDTVISFLKTT